MGTKNRLILIASAAAVLLGAGVLGVTALRAVSPADSDGGALSSKKAERRRGQPALSRIAPAATTCADPANDECEPQDNNQRLAGVESHKERWLKNHYPIEIAYDPNSGTETATAETDSQQAEPQSPEEANARLAEGQQRIVELFPELKASVEKMNSEIASERKLVDETGMTQQERAIHKYMNP